MFRLLSPNTREFSGIFARLVVSLPSSKNSYVPCYVGWRDYERKIRYAPSFSTQRKTSVSGESCRVLSVNTDQGVWRASKIHLVAEWTLSSPDHWSRYSYNFRKELLRPAVFYPPTQILELLKTQQTYTHFVWANRGKVRRDFREI